MTNNTHTQTLTNIYLYSPWLDPKTKIDQAGVLDFFPEAKQPRRLAFHRLVQGLSDEFIVALLGLRRLGKTTLAKQFLAHRFEHDFETYQDSLYYQFNERDHDLEQVLEVYFSEIMKAPTQRAKTTIVLDEIQHCKNWQVVLKKYHDLNSQLEFIVTGSTSIYIHEQTRESLAGRILDIFIEPISFWEYVYLKNELDFTDFVELQLTAGDFASPEQLVDKLRARNHYTAGLQTQFYQYLLDGEYPRMLFAQGQIDAQTYLKDQVLNKILRKDIKLFDIRNQKVVELLFASIAQDTSSIFNVSNLSAELGIAVNTLKKYLEVLGKAFLVHQTQNYRNSLRKRQASQKKFFASSLSLAIAATHTRGMVAAPIPSGYKGKLVETYVHNRIKTIFPGSTFFKKRRRSEFDVWLQVAGQLALPIEVKSKTKLQPTDFKYLHQAIDTNKVGWGVMASFADKLELDEQAQLVYAPVWLW